MTRKSLLIFLIFWVGRLSSQEVSSIQQLIDRSAIEYLQKAHNLSALYYGNLQEGHPRTTNHPYLVSDQYTKSRLSYLQTIYPEAMVRLDLSRNELLVISPDFRSIVLFPDNVDYVDLHGNHIFYFSNVNLPGAPSAGYYALLHSGNCLILKNQTAQLMQKDNNSTTMEYYYTFTTKYYLFKDGAFQIIRNQRGLLKALQPHKKELKRFISANHLLYRSYTDDFLVRTIKEYEKISGQK